MRSLLKKLEAKHEDLEENFSIISDERDLALSQVNELCNAFLIKQQEHAMVLRSHDLHVVDLQDHISEYISENSSLLFQMTVLRSTIYEISEKNSTLANSLSDVGAEKYNLFSQVCSLEKFKLKNSFARSPHTVCFAENPIHCLM
jgi:chromosome segregation ATPase